MTERSRPLLLTTDSDLLDDLLGLAAAAGVPVDVAVEPAATRPQWIDAPLVLVGVDLVDTLIDARLPGRAGVLLVSRGGPTDGLRDLVGAAGAEDVVDLTDGEAVLLDRLADVAEPPARSRVVGVVPGRGGAGASVLAAALALTAAAAGDPAWLVDLDVLGGGADVGLGAELRAGARWTDLGALSGRLSTSALRAALRQVAGVAVVSVGTDPDDPAPETVRAVLNAAGRGAGTVVLDLPRHRTAARDEAIAVADDVLVVVPTELRALFAARQVVRDLGPIRVEPRVVVRPTPGSLPGREVARELGLPSAGELPDEPAVRRALHTGEAAGLLRARALSDLCAALLDQPVREGAAA